MTDAANGSNFNRYSYANSNSYKYVDPDGRLGHLAAAFVIGFAIDVGAQHFIEGKSFGEIDYKGAAISGVGAAITGGIGGKLAQQAIQGTISASTAIVRTGMVGAVAGGLGSAATDVVNGQKVSGAKMVTGAIGGAVGAMIGAKIDNVAATTIGQMARSGGVMDHVASATRPSVNFGQSVSMGGSAGQAAGKVGSDAAVASTQKYIEKKSGL